MMIKDYLRLLKEHDLLRGENMVPGEVSGKICTDSRDLGSGDIFFCIKGFSSDGHSYAHYAMSHGAALIVHEEPLGFDHPAICVSDARKATALAAKLYYGDPSAKMVMIGITGTNGKTTTAHLVHQLLQGLGFQTGMIGTLGYKIGNECYETQHTTPDIIHLNSILAQMYEAGVSHVVMEVSSHALALDRVFGLGYRFCLFTNLSRDHLDFHRDMQDYAEAKFLLFARNPRAVAIINTDDDTGKTFYGRICAMGYKASSVSTQEANYQILNANCTLSGSSFELYHQHARYLLKTGLFGDFNVINAAMSFALLAEMGYAERTLPLMPCLLAPKGRMQAVANERELGIFVDYAHTPEALENVLKSASELPHRRILCLFGAGGDRDKGKRPMMLKTAMMHSDAVIITDDNPRFEKSLSIINDILRDTILWLPWWIIRDRKEAIRSILRLADKGDIVLICGKGHEDYQEVCGIRQHFDDVQTVEEILSDPLALELSDDELVLAIDAVMPEIIEHGAVQNFDLPQMHFRHLSTDSRSLQSGSIFYPLKGERFDGHAYMERVLADDANFAVCEDCKELHHTSVVANSTQSLGMLCRKYLMMFDPYKVALTGSTGKTTTKEMIYQVLSLHASTLKSEKNENNIIGVCRTILRIKPQHRYAVFELGTNHFGEIAAMAEVCNPNVGMVLNIGPSHLEFFINEDGVFTEKSTLLDRHLDLRIYPADDDRFMKYRHLGIAVGFADHSDLRISNVLKTGMGITFLINNEPFHLDYDIDFYATNAAFAIAVGRHLGFSQQNIQEALRRKLEMSQRMEIHTYNESLILADCYNANPVSMHKAIEHWHSMRLEKPHVAILGDMLELGDSANSYHQMIGAILTENGYDHLITVGTLSRDYHLGRAEQDTNHFNDVQSLLDADILRNLPSDAVILIKASHGIHLEKLLDLFGLKRG